MSVLEWSEWIFTQERFLDFENRIEVHSESGQKKLDERAEVVRELENRFAGKKNLTFDISFEAFLFKKRLI